MLKCENKIQVRHTGAGLRDARLKLKENPPKFEWFTDTPFLVQNFAEGETVSVVLRGVTQFWTDLEADWSPTLLDDKK